MKVCRGVGKVAIAAGVAVCGIGFWGVASAADTVQVDIKSLLNARAVSTFSNGKIYTWTMGIDGGGGGDGYVTHSVAVHLNYTGHTLPDSALYPANANHPKMLLNFSNADSTDPQTHYLKNNDSVSFSVPQGNYSKIYLALTSSEGSTTIDAVLNYSDGPSTSTFTLNDYDQGLATGVFYVDSAMQKWSNTNSPGDNNGHALNGFGVAANQAKTLTSVKLLKKTAGSYLVLWGVTGVGSNIPVSVSEPAGKVSSASIRMLSCRDGRVQFLNVKAGVELSVFSLSGERVARVASARQGTLTLGNHNADATVCPGVYICELRQGREIQRLQAIVGK
ncbi:MAG TPA: hypothetical protein VKF42_05425 [Chitinivibrionales bacterium]|nr:hypothetical protein [Chitinivibrionales bacterium]